MSHWEKRNELVRVWNRHNQPHHLCYFDTDWAGAGEHCPTLKFSTLREFLNDNGISVIPSLTRISGQDLDEPNFRSAKRRAEIPVEPFRAMGERLRGERSEAIRQQHRAVVNQALSNRAQKPQDAPERNNSTGVEGWTTEDLVNTVVLITQTLEVMKNEHVELRRAVDQLRADLGVTQHKVESTLRWIRKREIKRREKRARRRAKK